MIKFRSGSVNKNEIEALVRSGEDIGTSLARVNLQTKRYELSLIIDHLKNGANLFYDNGLITFAKRGQDVEPSFVFEQYKNILNAIPLKKDRQRVSIVIPDDPFSEDNAIEILNTYRADIRDLSARCRVILPVHHADNIEHHATKMLTALGYPKITLGIPCKRYIDRPNGEKYSARLSYKETATLLALKKPNGRKAWSGVHLLGISECSRDLSDHDRRTRVFAERCQQISKFGYVGSCDANRTLAFFSQAGSETKRASIGYELAAEYKKKVTKERTLSSTQYIKYSDECEIDEPLLYDHALSDIDNDPIQFVEKWNQSLPDFHMFELDVTGLEHEESKEHLQEILASIGPTITERLKQLYWRDLDTGLNTPGGNECRTEAIAAALSKSNDKQPLQLTMHIS